MGWDRGGHSCFRFVCVPLSSHTAAEPGETLFVRKPDQKPQPAGTSRATPHEAPGRYGTRNAWPAVSSRHSGTVSGGGHTGLPARRTGCGWVTRPRPKLKRIAEADRRWVPVVRHLPAPHPALRGGCNGDRLEGHPAGRGAPVCVQSGPYPLVGPGLYIRLLRSDQRGTGHCFLLRASSRSYQASLARVISSAQTAWCSRPMARIWL
jgi:hypothetical protein